METRPRAVCCAALINTSVSSKCVHHAHFSALSQTTMMKSCKTAKVALLQYHATALVYLHVVLNEKVDSE